MKAPQEFIDRYQNDDFPHRNELFAALASGKCELRTSPEDHQASLSCSHLLSIYRRRAEHLKRFNSPYSETLQDDTLALCEELSGNLDEGCLIWIFAMPPNSKFIVFEGTQRKRILGCLYAFDRQLWDD